MIFPEIAKCPRAKCDGKMNSGLALTNEDANERTILGNKKISDGILRDCLKCSICGHSVSTDHFEKLNREGTGI